MGFPGGLGGLVEEETVVKWHAVNGVMWWKSTFNEITWLMFCFASYLVTLNMVNKFLITYTPLNTVHCYFSHVLYYIFLLLLMRDVSRKTCCWMLLQRHVNCQTFSMDRWQSWINAWQYGRLKTHFLFLIEMTCVIVLLYAWMWGKIKNWVLYLWKSVLYNSLYSIIVCAINKTFLPPEHSCS